MRWQSVKVSSTNTEEEKERLRRYAKQRARLAAVAAFNAQLHHEAVARARAEQQAAARARRNSNRAAAGKIQVLEAPGLLGLGSAETVSAVRWGGQAVVRTCTTPHAVIPQFVRTKPHGAQLSTGEVLKTVDMLADRTPATQQHIDVPTAAQPMHHNHGDTHHPTHHPTHHSTHHAAPHHHPPSPRPSRLKPPPKQQQQQHTLAPPQPTTRPPRKPTVAVCRSTSVNTNAQYLRFSNRSKREHTPTPIHTLKGVEHLPTIPAGKTSRAKQ